MKPAKYNSRVSEIGDGNIKREGSEGKLNVGENKKHLISPNSYDARESKTKRRSLVKPRTLGGYSLHALEAK